MKTCRECLKTKPLAEFHKNKASKDGHQSLCKICHNAKNVEWLRANHGTESPKRSKYRAEFYLKNKVSEDANNKLYYLSNYDKYYEKMVARKMKLRRALPAWADRAKIKEIYSKAAKMRSFGIEVDVDHVIPIAGKLVCGLHVHNNLKIIKSVDNKSKSNKFEVA